MIKAVSILGSTGSIGRQSIAAAKHLGVPVVALTANKKTDLVEQQARELKPKFVAIFDENAAKDLKTRLADTDIRVGSGMEGLIEAATLNAADCVVTAVSGSVGLKPTLAAISEKKRIALANKETLVCAGEIVMPAAKAAGAEIVPRRLGTFCDLPVSNGKSARRAEKDPAHRQRRPVQRQKPRGA